MSPRIQTAGPLVVAVGGGKGGVGKSMLTANLGVALAQTGARVIMVDADLGSANLHTMLGIDRPGATLRAFVERDVESLTEVVIGTAFPRLELVPGSVAIPGAANLGHGRKLKLMRHIATLDTDVVLIDCGAGVHFNVIDFYNASDLRLLVATPQLISLQNAYGFAKGAVYRLLRQSAKNAREKQLVDNASRPSETEDIRHLIERVAVEDPGLARRLKHALANFRIDLIGNQVGDRGELNPIHALSRMLSDFLSLRVPVIGALRRSARIHYSVGRRTPFVGMSATDLESRLLFSLAERIIELDVGELRHQRNDSHIEGLQPDPKAQGGGADSALPQSLERYQREHLRLEVVWPATLTLGTRRFKVQVQDISTGGAKVVWGGAVEVGTRLQVRFDVGEQPVQLRCIVVHHRADSLGLQFDGADSRAVDELLRRALAEQAPAAAMASGA